MGLSVYLNPISSSFSSRLLIHFSVFSTATSHPWTDNDMVLVKGHMFKAVLI